MWRSVALYFGGQMEYNILDKVEKPSRYVGGEFNSIVKQPDGVRVTFALAFPDIYEVGMSYLGFKILYHLLNKVEYVAAERIYAPWTDMQRELRAAGLPLSSMETGRALKNFDLVGFTLQYELSYSNILNMLDMGGLPLLATERTLEQPFVVGGGPCVYNPEPLADFFDFFIVGEGEELIIEVARAFDEWKTAGRSGGRTGFLQSVAKLTGIYVPSFYKPQYGENGDFERLDRLSGDAPAVVYKRIVEDMDAVDYPTAPVVPFSDIVHDRIMLEVFRGCTRGCRFCHAGMAYRPVRERSLPVLKRLAREAVDNTGYDEISLVSLSTADYSCLQPLVAELMDEMKTERVSVSLPSLRIDSFSVELAKKIQTVRKSSLTFAPEAGTQRMRDVINKGVSEEDLMNAVGAAFKAGWTSVKLYFMIGLPGETEEDVRGIADLAYKVLDCYRAATGRKNGQVTVSVSSFVPKPWTPFQWSRQDTLEEIRQKQALLRELLKNKAITFQYHDAKTSMLEGVFARGDRRLGAALHTAWQKGARFDGWSEYFAFDVWQEALDAHGLAMDFYNGRVRGDSEKFPWEHVSPGIDKGFLRREYERALAAQLTEDCRRGACSACGVCPALSARIVDHSDKAVEG